MWLRCTTLSILLIIAEMSGPMIEVLKPQVNASRRLYAPETHKVGAWILLATERLDPALGRMDTVHRVVFTWQADVIRLLHVGTHDDVY